MGKQNKWPGKGWQELVGLTPAPSSNSEDPSVENPNTPEEPQESVKINISATVTDGENPISSATVTLTNDNKTITGTTGSAGGCTLSNVELGTYTVTASASGYTEYTDSLTVTNETTTLAITMSIAEVLEQNPDPTL